MTFWDFFGATVDLKVVEFILLGLGWIFMLGLAMILIFVFAKTPAKDFIVSFIRKRPLVFMKTRDGSGFFKAGNTAIAGTADVKGVGPIALQEGSYVREFKSGVPIYECFNENATSLSQTYAAILTEMRELGFYITNFEQYESIIAMANDDVKYEEYKAKLDDPQVIANFEEKMTNLKNAGISIKPFKTYTTHELSNMFPFNMNPAYVEQYSTAQLNAFIKKHKINREIIIYACVGVAILAVVAIMLLKFTGGDSGGAAQVVCQFPDAVQYVATNASVATNAINI